MKVCMVAYTYYEQDNRVRRYAEALAKRGDEVDAFVLKMPGQPSTGELNGVRIHRLQRRVINEIHPVTYLVKLLLFMFLSAAALTWNCRKRRYDVIHVHSVPDFEVFAALIPKLLGSRLILDVHDIVPEFYASKFKKGPDSLIFKMLVLVEKWSTGFVDHVIIANHIWHGTLTSRSVPEDKCTVVLNYPDLSIFRRIARTRNDGKFVFIYPGSLNWHQGIEIAIRAMAKLVERHPNAEFHIYGGGKEEGELQALAGQLGLKEHVRFMGMKSMEEVGVAMSNADAGLVPKRAVGFGDEAFSTKILEFMAMGIPTIASSTRIDRYYFSDDQILFFKSEDVDDLAVKMETIMLDAGLRQRMVENCNRYIGENNWDVKRNEYFELIRKLVA
jgi:glycosyltransferase involved in cell wall biosynthesis